MMRAANAFGCYTLVDRIGIGGMAEVWLARVSGPAGFSRSVVVKRTLSHLNRDPQFASMFLDEARLSARLSHPNIVQVYELGEVDGERQARGQTPQTLTFARSPARHRVRLLLAGHRPVELDFVPDRDVRIETALVRAAPPPRLRPAKPTPRPPAHRPTDDVADPFQ